MTTLALTSGNPAKTDHPVHPLIAQRWSPRAFSARPVDPALLRSVLEAARWAPSAANQQPWHFIVAPLSDPSLHARLLGTLLEKNQEWAQHAPVLMLIIAKHYTDRNGNSNTRSYYDAGLAVGSLTVQATAHGLVVHQMGGFDADKAREEFGIPKDHQPLAAIALGYLGDAQDLPDDLREREQAQRTRKPLRDFVYGGTWGESSAITAP